MKDTCLKILLTMLLCTLFSSDVLAQKKYRTVTQDAWESPWWFNAFSVGFEVREEPGWQYDLGHARFKNFSIGVLSAYEYNKGDALVYYFPIGLNYPLVVQSRYIFGVDSRASFLGVSGYYPLVVDVSLRMDFKYAAILQLGYRTPRKLDFEYFDNPKNFGGLYLSLSVGLMGGDIRRVAKSYKIELPPPRLSIRRDTLDNLIELSHDKPSQRKILIIENEGKGVAENVTLEAVLGNTPATNISIDQQYIGIISAGSRIARNIVISATEEIKRREEIPITFQVIEKDGFNAQSTYRLVLYPKAEIEQYPPVLFTEIEFIDGNNNGILDAEEQGEIALIIHNSGRGNAWSLDINFELKNKHIINGLEPFQKNFSIRQIEPGSSQVLRVPLKARKEIPTTQLEFVATIREANGFDPDPVHILLNTQAFIPPQLTIADVGVSDEAGRGIIRPGEVIRVTARVSNRGQGIAEDVIFSVTAGENVFIRGRERGFLSETIGRLYPGEYYDVTFEAFCNTRAQSFPLYVTIEEKEGEYGIHNYDLGLELERQQRTPSEFHIPTRETIASHISDSPALAISIERNIPQATRPNQDAIAVVIGNRSYRSDTPDVTFALRDASLVRRYAEQALGYRAGNILYLEDATLTEMRVIFGDDRNAKGRLSDLVKKGISDVLIYYSGHGAPDINTRTAYLMPVDADPNRLALTGYSLEILYNNLSELGARSVTVIIDACFSGATGAGDMLIAHASPIGIEVRDPAARITNGVIITASTGSQIASWYPDKRHGLLTYFFLKGLQGSADLNGDGKITVGEMQQYLTHLNDGVPYHARRLHGRDQNPQVWGDYKTILR